MKDTCETEVNKEKENRLHYDQIDALKGIAISLVVLGHSIIKYPINLHENTICDLVFRWLSSVHMPLFFWISGFCFSYSGNYKGYLWKKIKRLVIPYIVFGAIDIVPRVLLPALINRPRGIGESVQRILLYGGEYWFLYTLFIIFLIFPPVYQWIRKDIGKSMIVIMVLFGIYAFMPDIPLFKLSSVTYYILYFTLGVIIRQFVGDKVFKQNYNKVQLGCLIVALFAVWLGLIGMNAPNLKILAALIGIVTLYLCVQYGPVVSLFQRFGKYSLQLYLFNGYFLVISRTLVVSVLGISNAFIVVTVNMIIDFFLSYIFIKYICDRVKIIKILTGML